MNCYGTGNFNDYEILSHIYVKEKNQAKPVGQSFVTVTAAKVGLDVVELG